MDPSSDDLVGVGEGYGDELGAPRGEDVLGVGLLVSFVQGMSMIGALGMRGIVKARCDPGASPNTAPVPHCTFLISRMILLIHLKQ